MTDARIVTAIVPAQADCDCRWAAAQLQSKTNGALRGIIRPCRAGTHTESTTKATFNGSSGNNSFTGTSGIDVFNHGDVTYSGSAIVSARGINTIRPGGAYALLDLGNVTMGCINADRVCNEFVIGIFASPREDDTQDPTPPIGGVTIRNFFAPDGNDSLVGTAARDYMDSEPGNDTLLGLGGADDLKGGAGNDRIDDGSGSDELYGESGSDTLSIGVSNALGKAQEWALGRLGRLAAVGSAWTWRLDSRVVPIPLVLRRSQGAARHGHHCNA